MIRFLQINLHRSSTAQSLLQQTAAVTGAQVLLVSEYNWRPHSDRWVVSDDLSCAVALTASADFTPGSTGSGRGYAWIQTQGLRIYSCYTSRNDSEQNFRAFLLDIQDSVRSADPLLTVVVGGDFNAWSQEWGSARNDDRGDRLADLAASLDLLVANVGTTPTYCRVNAESIIDVTFSRLIAPGAIRDWKVLDEVYSASDHRYVAFILDRVTEGEEIVGPASRGWSYRQLNPGALAAYLANTAEPIVSVETTASDAADSLIKYLEGACDSCMPPRKLHRSGRSEVHWWSNELTALRNSTIKLRRAHQRSSRRHDPQHTIDAHREAYKSKRKELRNAIRDAQSNSWAELCKAVDEDPWGLPYKVVTKKVGRSRPGIEARGREEAIADHLFPDPPPTTWSLEPPLTDDEQQQQRQEFTMVEILMACKRLPAGKATGPDGIPNEVLLHVSRLRPQVLLNTFNACLARREFPARWKTARLVLLHKGSGKPIDEPSSFRPLCMLDSAGKLLERLLLGRLNQHLDETGQRSENQFGFRNGRSTVDAIERVLQAAHGAATGAVQHRDICVAVSLDVKNAFNTAPWRKIDAALRASHTPPYLNNFIRSYLDGRKLQVGQLLLSRNVTCGVPQGSVLGPALWNVFYDKLLDLEMPSGVQLVAFADDVCVLGIARNGEAAATLLNPVLEKVSDWMTDNGLKLAPAKTEAVVLTRKNLYANPELFVEGHAIPIKPSMRYLGVELDTRLSFTKHVHQASLKACQSALAIGRLMPNIGGPSHSKRALLGSVTNSKMLYASPAWAVRGTKTAKNRLAMARAQRTVALRTIRAYCTVSAEASSILASMLPADLLATERTRIRSRMDDQTDETPTNTLKNQERLLSIAAWQARWDRSKNARWTHRLIPDVSRWLAKPTLNLTYRLTQALSGHGCFKSYLLRMNRADDSNCVYCGYPDDTAEHTLFECPRWTDDRSRVAEILRRPPNASDVEEILCGPPTDGMPEDADARHRLITQAAVNRRELIGMVESILSRKEIDERETEAGIRLEAI